MTSATVRKELWGMAWVTGVVALLAFTYFSDGDLGFHLATGREVLATGEIPRTNVLSYTQPHFPWPAHQWLPGVLFEWTLQAYGDGGLQAFKVLLVSATWLVVYGAARLVGAGVAAAALATVLAASAAAFRFELRPYLFTHFALAAMLCCSAYYVRARAHNERRHARRALLGLTLVPVVACHFHAGVIDCWLVFVALSAGAALEFARGRFVRTGPCPPAGLRDAAWLSFALCASVAMASASLALYHPFGARVLRVPFDMATDTYLAEHLLEFRAPAAFSVWQLAPYWFFSGLTCLFFLRLAPRLHAFWTLLVLGFFVLSLRHVRLAFGFAIVATPLLALGIARASAVIRPHFRVFAAVALSASALLHRYSVAQLGTGYAAETFPPYLFAYLERQQLRGPDFVSDAWAAPWLGRAYPGRKAFFDNRFDAYPRSFFRDVYQHIRYGLPGWDALLDQYGVELVLLRYTSAGEARFQHDQPNLRQRLAADPRWALVTFDDLGALFVRRDGKNRVHAGAYTLPKIDPDRLRFLDRPRTAVTALRREIARGNTATRVLLLAAYAERDAGELVAADALIKRAAHGQHAAALHAMLVRQLGR